MGDPTDDRDGPANRPPPRPEELRRAADGMMQVDRGRGYRAAVLPQKSQVRRDPGTDREYETKNKAEIHCHHPKNAPDRALPAARRTQAPPSGRDSSFGAPNAGGRSRHGRVRVA